VTADAPLYERDPEAWRAHLAEGNASQPRKRVSADLLVCDTHDAILLVDPVYKPGWDLPGGMAEANEPPDRAAGREVREELDLDATPGRLLCVDWVPPREPWDDLLAFIFDGGTLSAARISSLRLMDGELRAFEFCESIQAEDRLPARSWRRLAAALDALRSGGVRYLRDGYPAA
jgi:ADP-ribose pyrophosphatase YjhB (NUDIX family)